MSFESDVVPPESSIVDTELYTKYDVKRGLRHVSGKGVLAGLTQIGDVVGSAPDGDQYVPIPGELVYRGIEINELVDGFLREGRLGFEETAYLVLFGELPGAFAPRAARGPVAPGSSARITLDRYATAS